MKQLKFTIHIRITDAAMAQRFEQRLIQTAERFFQDNGGNIIDKDSSFWENITIEEVVPK
jgi:hypothetical protein